MGMQLSEALAVLDRTPRVLRTFLEGLPEEWTDAREAPETFSPRDVVAHLVHGEEEDWMPRVRLLLEHGTARTFPAFDPNGFRERAGGRALSELLDRFEELRGDNLLALRALRLGADALAREGRHPEFGEVTLAQHLSTWVVHDLAHLGQISRVMAKRWKDEVGPWRAYLRVLDR